MRSTWKKIVFALYCVLALIAVPVSVSANTIIQDGIEASLATDKTAYKDTDSVTVTLQVKNRNTEPINGITLTNLTPDGYVGLNQTQEKIETYTLASGETISISTTFVKANNKILAPVTGDKCSLFVFMVLVILGVGLICIAYKKNKNNMIALLLCVCLLVTLDPSFFIEEVNAANVTVSKTINLNTAVKVDGEDIQFRANVKYDYVTDAKGDKLDSTCGNISENANGTKTYTRGEWIRLLLDKMEVRRVNVADEDYVYHFTDTENGTYGVDAETAWAYSILPEENENMPVFNENAIVTREYAAYTIYHIMGFEGNYVATCADAEQLEYPNEVALISAEGFISLNNQCFEPNTNLCESDVVQIFAMIDNYNDSLYVDFDDQVYNITYADGVIEISSTNYEVIKNADGTYSITLPVNEQTSALVEGSVIVLPQNENSDALGLKVNSIGISASSVTLLCSEPAMDELLASYDIAGYGTSISSNTIETPEGVSVEYSEEATSNANLATYDIDTSTPNLGKLKFTLGGDKCPYSGTVEVSIPQIQVRLKGNGTDVEECSWLMKTTTKINGSVSVGTYLKPEGGSKFYLTPNGIDIPIAVGVSVNVKIYLYYSVDGSVTIGYETTNIEGCQYKNGTLRYISDMSSVQIAKPTTDISAEAKLGVGIAGALNLLCMNVVQLDATVGGCISAKQTVHNDISPVLHCNQLAEYLFFDISLDKNSLIGYILDKVNISWKKTIWKETNSPFSLMVHLENGVEVPACTYGYGHLVGTVIDSSTGEAIGNAQIVFKDKKSETIIQTVYSSTTEDAVSELKVGDFIGKSLPAGEYSVEVSADGYKAVCVDAIAKKDERTEIGTISLVPDDNKETTNTYSIDFSGNGADSGSVEAINNCKYGEFYTLPENSFVRDGYRFVGWNEKADGSGTTYAAGEKVSNLTMDNDVCITLYAIWVIDDKTVLTAGNYSIHADDYGYRLKAGNGCIVSYEDGNNNLKFKEVLSEGTTIDIVRDDKLNITIESGTMYIYCWDPEDQDNQLYVEDLGHEAVYGYVLSAGESLTLDNQYYDAHINSNSVYVYGGMEEGASITRHTTDYWWNKYIGFDVSENTYNNQGPRTWCESISSCNKTEYTVISGNIKIYMHYEDKDKLVASY